MLGRIPFGKMMIEQPNIRNQDLNKIKTPVGFSDKEVEIFGYKLPATGRLAYLVEGLFAGIWL